MEDNSDISKPSQAELYRAQIFDRINTLISENPEAIERSVAIQPDGGMDTEAAANLMLNQPHVDLTKLETGDVVWWKSKTGTTGFFVLEENKGDRGIWGPMRMIDEEGKVKKEHEKASIDGASFGGMLLINRVSKNIPMEYRVPGQIDSTDFSTQEFFEMENKAGHKALLPKLYHTSTVIDVGVIKGSLLKPQTGNS